MAKRRVAVMISGRGSNMSALIEAAKDENYPAEIALVLSNRPDVGGIAIAQAAGVVTEVVDHTKFGSDRGAFERAVQARFEAHRIHLVCCAGFMRVMTPWLISQWPWRMLNIHPSLLPAYKGLDTHARAIADGAKEHGATVHFVVPELDSGPIILQEVVPVLPGDTPETLAARVIKVEHRIYPYSLRLVAEGLVTVVNGRTVIAPRRD